MMLQKEKEHNWNWPQIVDHRYRILIIGGSGSGKKLFNEKSHEPGIDKIYLHAKDPYEAKYKLLISKREITGLKQFSDSRAFIKYNPSKERKILIEFDDMIADMLSNKKLNPINSNWIIY